MQDLQQIANRIKSAPILAFDCETTDPHLTVRGPGFVRGDAEVIGVAIAWPTVGGPSHPAALSAAGVPDRSAQVGRDIDSVYLPIGHAAGNLDRDQVLAMLTDSFGARKAPAVAANISYDLEALASHGVRMTCPGYDVQIAEALLDENRRSYKLDTLAQHYLGEGKLTDTLTQTIALKLGVKKEKAMSHLARLDAADVAAYACADTALTLGVWQKQAPLIEREDLSRVWQLECDLVPALQAMRWHGVRIDVDAAERFVTVNRGVLAQYQQALKHVSGVDVQIWAHASVADAAKRAGTRGDLAEQVLREAVAGRESFTSPWMMKQEHPFFVNLVAARRVDKAITYVLSLLDYQVKGRVHGQYHQTRGDRSGARSGRLSASHPNLQQVPGRFEDLAKPIRQLFLPDEGELWASNDYSQAEPRITVHYAHVMGLTGAAAARQRYIDDPQTDYHQMVADMCTIARFPAKTLNLGLAYGMGKAKMADALGLPLDEATALFNQYHAGVPYVKALADRCTAVASQRGYVKTITGRRRRFDLWGPRRWTPGLVPKKFDEAKAEFGPNLSRYFVHKAMNAVVQGTAADICKTAMVALYREGVLPLMSIHDDLPCSIAPGAAGEEAMRAVKHVMETCVPLSVPHLVQPAAGATWGDCK